MYESFQYNRTLSDTSSTSLSDYPSKIVLNSSNFDFAHCKQGGADIRFYDETISSAIPYWIEKWENNEAVVWIKISDTNNIIKMYYGDESANSESNFSDVFQHGSDFESDFGDLTPIVAGGGSVTIADSSATLGDDAFWQCLVGKEVLSNPDGVYLRDLYPVRDLNDRYLPDANGHIVAHVNSMRTSDDFATIMRTTSPDGINWSELEPVLNDGTSKRDANVIKISEGIFKLWCRVGDTGDLIRYTSVDGLSWINPEIVLSTSAFNGIVAGIGMQVPWITPLTDGRLALVFGGYSLGLVYKIWGATSNDMGETWSPLNSGDPIFSGSLTWEWHVANPKLIQIADGTYILEYNGRTSNTPWSIGVATSTDLINWVPNPINPILYGTKATYGFEVAGYAKSQNGFLHWHQPTSGGNKTSRIWYSKPIVKKGCLLLTRTQNDAAGMCINLTGLNNYSVETESVLGADGAFENTDSKDTIFELIDRSSVLSSGVTYNSLTRRLAVRRVGFDLSTNSGKILIIKYGTQTQYWSGSGWTNTITYLDCDADAYVNVKFDCDDTNYVLTVSGFDPIVIPKSDLTFTNGMILLLGDMYNMGYGPLRSFYTYVRVRPYAVTEPSFALGEEIGTVYDVSLSIDRAVALSTGSNADFGVFMELIRSIDFDSGSNWVLNDLLSLDRQLNADFSATSILNTLLAIDKLLSVVETASAATEAVSILATIKSIAVTRGTSYELEINVDKTLNLSTANSANYQTELSLIALKNMIASADSLSMSNVSVSKNLSLELIAQALSLASLNAGYSVSIEASATDSTIVIRTPAERIIKITFENNTVKVPYDNRIIKIPHENRTIKIK
jgi:hypothetical protein